MRPASGIVWSDLASWVFRGAFGLVAHVLNGQVGSRLPAPFSEVFLPTNRREMRGGRTSHASVPADSELHGALANGQTLP